MTSKLSDVPAKEAYKDWLISQGYQARVQKTPTDIIAEKDGQTWYFEIKMTRHTDRYFGGATLPEWAQAFKDPEHFRFVIAFSDASGEHFQFKEYTPEEFMAFSTVPPFKVFFNIDFTGKQKKSTKKRKSIPMTLENFRTLSDSYDRLTRGGGK